MQYNWINIDGDAITLKDSSITNIHLMSVKDKADVAKEILQACFSNNDVNIEQNNPYFGQHPISGGYEVSDGEIFMTFNVSKKHSHRVRLKLHSTAQRRKIRRNVPFNNQGVLSIQEIIKVKNELLSLDNIQSTRSVLYGYRKVQELRRILEQYGSIRNANISISNWWADKNQSDDFFTISLHRLTSADIQLLMTIFKGITS